jgi:hypothetical protein
MVDGARAVRESILQAAPNQGTQVFPVWIKIYDVDTIEAAQSAAGQLDFKTPVNHFYDPHQLLGRTIGQGLGAKSGETAWDVYLFYGRDDRWDDRFPQPIDWAHQLLGSSWADAERLYRGNNLTERLQDIMYKLTGGDLRAKRWLREEFNA